MNAAVVVGPGSARDPRLDELARDATLCAGDVPGALALARELGNPVPDPGCGRTADRWSFLATLAAADLTVARAVEPHLDALAILRESAAGSDEAYDVPPDSTWGVFAAEGPGGGLTARQEPGEWRLDGTKPWCSLAETVSHALVTAWVDDRTRGLFAVALREPEVRCSSEPWVAHGLSAIRSTSVGFEGAEAALIGTPGWYLSRDGFAWGGMGVAAVWYGGAVGLIRRLQRAATERALDQLGEAQLGAADAASSGARAVLDDAACRVDAGSARGRDGIVLNLRVRQVVFDAAELVLRVADDALGPAPLAREPAHANRVSDLRMYLRQHHGQRDAAALGRLVAEQRPW